MSRHLKRILTQQAEHLGVFQDGFREAYRVVDGVPINANIVSLYILGNRIS